MGISEGIKPECVDYGLNELLIFLLGTFGSASLFPSK